MRVHHPRVIAVAAVLVGISALYLHAQTSGEVRAQELRVWAEQGDAVAEYTLALMYADGDGHHFMDTESYEQVQLIADTLGDSVNYLLPDSTITVAFFEGDPVGIELPLTVDLAVRETAPAIKGATASAQLKPATLETGLMVQVPPFIANGDKVRVNTETGEYQARA